MFYTLFKEEITYLILLKFFLFTGQIHNETGYKSTNAECEHIITAMYV